MPPKKPFKSKFKIQLLAGVATPAPPVGPVLGQHGVNIQAFCSEFNDKTAELKSSGLKVPAICYVFEDKSFQMEIKTPLTSALIKQELKIKKGSGRPNTEKIGKISRAQLENVAEKKMRDLNANDMDAAVKIVAGTAKRMGLEPEV
ncbi:50S ribosomal protein L11 [bacterium]|jgi:large subunit ribosomal protein L11|nr:50S ribosomal protein L11 [bacterium]MBT6831501.1 50S ribosomal protein L11 [bacterium]MBT6996055.1 50S ribosomal protein L11 [bacterium]MBT7772176.1 50S ribosomal protein L11 [bacterium]